MSKITFLYSWDDGGKNAWSGTPNGLFNALAKKVELRKLYVAASAKTKIGKLFAPLYNYRNAKKIINSDPEISFDAPYFSFGEYSSKVVANTYCYQDLSVDYLIRELKVKNSSYSHLSKFAKFAFLLQLKAKHKRANEFYQKCGGIFTMSEWLKNDLVNVVGIPENKVYHVGGGCSLDVSRIDVSKKQGNKFLFVGKKWNIKNGDLVVATFEKLKEMHPERNPELYIAGPNTIPSIAENKENIHFLGLLSYDELAYYYNLCDYFVMPSNCDAYGLVFAEALIFGLPCIGKNCYAMPEFIQRGENGYLIDNNDVHELAGAMEKLLLDGSTMAKYVQEKQQYYVEKYSWDSVAERIVDILRKRDYNI